MHRSFRNYFILFLGVAIAACDSIPNLSNNPTAIPAPLTPTNIPIETPNIVSPVTPAPVTPTSQSLQIKVWLPPEFGDVENSSKAAELGELIATFDAQNANLDIRIQQKLVGGQGGILSYLRTGRNVAPTALPDLVLMPANQLPTAFNEQLIFPLKPLISDEIVTDLFPAAKDLAEVDGELAGFPFVITRLTHLAFSPAVISDTVPTTWEALAATSGRLILPASGSDGVDLALQLYLDQGGLLQNENGQNQLQPEIFSEVLQLFAGGRQNEFILLDSSNAGTYDDAWAFFRSGAASLVPISADIFLNERNAGMEAGFAAFPGINSPLTTLVDSWVWVVTTPEFNRQQVAAELLGWLTNDANLGSWSERNGLLPARATAFSQWTVNDDYHLFLQKQLESAQPYPIRLSSSAQTALSEALFTIISLANSPEDAAAEAAQKINR